MQLSGEAVKHGILVSCQAGDDVPNLFVNPNLPNYFMSADEVVVGSKPRSYVKEYESAKVITFPNLKLDIDFDFWASLDAEQFPALKKFGHSPDLSNLTNMTQAVSKAQSKGVPDDLIGTMCKEMSKFYATLLPVYQSIFSDYEFHKTNVVWRLNTIRTENMHLDCYANPSPYHFARMFVNLDTQPRIWQTSWPYEDVVKLARGKVPADVLETATANDLWYYINKSVFGKSSREWWDDQPRHVAYFDPGDVWIVDSRQVSHQIFYGRRAASIDFFIKPEKMLDPGKYYLSIADRFREENASKSRTHFLKKLFAPH